MREGGAGEVRGDGKPAVRGGAEGGGGGAADEATAAGPAAVERRL